MKVLTFNACLAPFLWRPYKRARQLANELQRLQTDVIALQEVHTYDLLFLLKRALQDYNCTYQRSIVGPRAGLVVFTKLPASTCKFTSLAHLRGFLSVELPTCNVVNVHLSANTDGDWSPQNRFYDRQKAELIKLNQLPIMRPTIMLGDFNLAKTSNLYTEFASKWHDTAASDNAPTFRAEFLPAGRTPQRIDYIFTTDELTTLGSLNLFDQKFLSNHIGLITEIT